MQDASYLLKSVSHRTQFFFLFAFRRKSSKNSDKLTEKTRAMICHGAWDCQLFWKESEIKLQRVTYSLAIKIRQKKGSWGMEWHLWCCLCQSQTAPASQNPVQSRRAGLKTRRRRKMRRVHFSRLEAESTVDPHPIWESKIPVVWIIRMLRLIVDMIKNMAKDHPFWWPDCQKRGYACDQTTSFGMTLETLIDFDAD